MSGSTWRRLVICIAVAAVFGVISSKTGIVGWQTALAAVGEQAADGPAGEVPNFVIIFTDDQGYQDVGCFGSPDIRTPNLDRMAAEGMKFTDFYVTAPVCSPSRASLMTGSYCDRVSVTRVFFPRDNTGLHPNELTIAELLQTRGYATACIGKWHLGHLPPFLPTNQGFDYYFGIPYSNDMSIERDGKRGPPVYRNDQIVEHPAEQATLTKRYTEEAVKFIEQNRQRPFFLYLAHTMPHVPLAASEAFLGKSKRGLYGDVIEEIDWSVGQVLEALRRLGLSEKTIVVFTSDNGPWLIMKKHGGSALPLRDGKGTLYEGGMRVPCIMWGPGRIPAGKTCSEVAATIDILPTFAALAGAKLPEDRIIDGKDIWPLMSGQPGAKSPHQAFFYRRNGVRAGNWKLLLTAAKPAQSAAKPGEKQPPKSADAPDSKAGQSQTAKPAAAPPTVELYDLATDIGEKNNLAEQHPDVVDRLRKLLQDHNAEINKNQRPQGVVEPSP